MSIEILTRAHAMEQPASPARIAAITIPRAFYDRSAVRATVLTVVNIAVVVAAGPVAYAIDSPMLYLTAFVLVGARAQALYILQHECMHWLLYKSKQTNDVCGMLLSGLLGTGLNYGRLFHFKHHRTVGSTDDPNRVWHDTDLHLPGWSTFWFFLGQAAGMRLIALVVRYAAAFSGKPAVVPSPASSSLSASRMSVDFVVVLVLQVVLWGAITAASSWWVYLVFFLLPLVTLTSFFEAVRSFSEHVLPGERGTSPVEEARLFFMDASGVERFFFSQFGFHYHHLHHLYPGVVTFKLRELDSWLRKNDPSYASKYVRRDGYIRTAIRYVLGRPLVLKPSV